MLDLQHVTVRFGGVVPLDAVDIVFDAPVCGLIGPNGAGKTTLLNVLSGFVTPASGQVYSERTNLLALSPHRRARWGLRRTFQTEQLASQLSVHDNVLTAVENLGGRRAPGTSVADALDFVGLSKHAGQTPRELSSFQRKRLEFARAIAGRPRVLLLDEPGAGVAAEETEALANMIRTVGEFAGTQVVLIDHDVNLVRSVCTSLTVLDFGRVIGTGPTADILNDPVVQRAYLGAEDL